MWKEGPVKISLAEVWKAIWKCEDQKLKYQEGHYTISSKNNHGQKLIGMGKLGNNFKLKTEVPPNAFTVFIEFFLSQLWHQVHHGNCFVFLWDLLRD